MRANVPGARPHSSGGHHGVDFGIVVLVECEMTPGWVLSDGGLSGCLCVYIQCSRRLGLAEPRGFGASAPDARVNVRGCLEICPLGWALNQFLCACSFPGCLGTCPCLEVVGVCVCVRLGKSPRLKHV